jgi:CopG family nickel-responsive transcriptional regulator
VRFGISLDKELLRDFDRLISKIGYPNRSEAIRDLIRDRLVKQEWKVSDEEAIGTVTIVYSHEVGELTERLMELQHHYHHAIISTMHIHLDKHNCLEVIAVKGKASDIKNIANRLLSTKGIKHGKLSTTTTGKKLT